MSERAKAMHFLDRFFAPPNEIRLTGLEPEFRAWLQPWIEDLEGPADKPVVLPSRRNGRVQWFGLAFSDRQARSLRDDLVAFVGPSYSDFSGRVAQLDPSDRIEAAVLELTDGHAYRFAVEPSTAVKAARDSLTLMRATWERRPDRSRPVQPPFGRILRDFNMALEARQPEESARLLEQLSGIGRLTASNLIFLKIQRLAALGRWTDLLSLPEIATVLSMRRPNAVSDALLKALYHTEFADFEVAGQPAEALEHFQSVVLSSYAPLFKAQSPMRSPEAAKLFMMLAVSTTPPRPDLQAELVSQPDLEAQDLAYLRLLMGPGGVTHDAEAEIGDAASRASTAIRIGDFDLAYRLLVAELPNAATVPMLLRCAYELGTLESSRWAISAFTSLDPSAQASILEQRAYRSWWASLDAAGQMADARASLREPPADWCEWMDRLNTEGAFPGAIEIAATGATEWRIAELVDDPKRVADLAAALLTERPPEAQAILRNATPYLVAFLRQAPEPPPVLRSIYQSAALLIASDDQLGSADLAVLLDLAEDLLGIGLNTADYEELVGYLRNVWIENASPKYVDWGLDVMDCLAQFPVRSEMARERFVAQVTGSLLPWLRRLQDYQISLLGVLGPELGAGDLVGPLLAARKELEVEVEAGGPSALSSLAGRKVGIYTLTEAVGRHVRGILLRTADGVQVDLNHDRVGTDKLKHLARDSDILLVAVRSAKHAATDFIEAHRAANRPTLVCPGKGSASMLRTLLTYLERHL